jgi:arylsulfatase A-like enzyme
MDPWKIGRRAFLATPLILLAAEKKPNIVLVIARGWRQDPAIPAPNLEKFAEDAVLFPRAYAVDPRPAPARSAILTGRYPHSTGIIDETTPMRVEEVTIDSALRTAGYQTGNQIEQTGPGPFVLNVTLASRAPKPVDASTIHLRDNVPEASANATAKTLAERYGTFRAMDEEFGKLLASLETRKLADNTIVVFTADCGDQIGSHGLNGDDTFYEESVRVPLAIRFPRVISRGLKSDLLACHTDIMPTLLGLCGEPLPEGMQGNDLSPLLISQKGERPESVYIEGKLGQKEEWRAMVLGSDKIVVDAQAELTHLFNLAEDPFEMTNLAHQPASQLKRDQLMAQMRASRQRLLDFKRR